MDRFHQLIRLHTRPQALLNSYVSDSFLELSERYYEEADASENEARKRYIRYWADRMAMEAL